MAAVMADAASVDGQRVGSASTSSTVTDEGSTSATTSWTCDTQASTSTPTRSASSLRATAPAATLPIVSRADARPPPATARIPYLASVVQSAWDGR